MKVASFLGALALAASVFFLFYQFWGRFGETAQVTILVAAALATLGLTLWVQGRDASGYFTIGEAKLRASQLPDQVQRADGFVLLRPAHWR
jgi:hypothetical protein